MAYTLLAFSKKTFEQGYHIPRYEKMDELNQLFSDFKVSIRDVFENVDENEDFEISLQKINNRLQNSDLQNYNMPISRFVSTFYKIWNEFDLALPDRVEGFNFNHLLSELDIRDFFENRENRTVDNLVISTVLVNNVMEIVQFFQNESKYTNSFVEPENNYEGVELNHQYSLQYYVEEGARLIGFTWNSLCRGVFRVLRSLTKGMSYLIHSHYIKRDIDDRDNNNIFLAFAEYGYCEFPTRGFSVNVQVPNYPIIDKKTGTFHICAGLSGSILELEHTLFLSFSGTHTHGPYKVGDRIADFVQILFTFPNYLGAVKILEELCTTIGRNYYEIIVTGHSLGGGLSQFAFGHNARNFRNLFGIGFNSAGLSKPNFSEVKRFVGDWRFTHVFVDNDWVHQYGNHIGVAIELEHLQGYSRCKSHSIDAIFAIIGEECHCEPI